jgi:predicted hydrocarbon binding protein
MAESRDEQRYCPNKFARIYLGAIEDVMGSNGVAAVLNLARLGHLIDNYPPDNLNREFSFRDFARINQAVEDIYGERGARGLCCGAGRATFKHVLKGAGLMSGLSDPAFGLLPLGLRVRVGLTAMAETFSRLSDQLTRLEEDEHCFAYIVDYCPVCWGRTSHVPICHAATGILQEALHWASGGQSFSIAETECIAKGDNTCTFIVDKRPAEY